MSKTAISAPNNSIMRLITPTRLSMIIELVDGKFKVWVLELRKGLNLDRKGLVCICLVAANFCLLYWNTFYNQTNVKAYISSQTPESSTPAWALHLKAKIEIDSSRFSRPPNVPFWTMIHSAENNAKQKLMNLSSHPKYIKSREWAADSLFSLFLPKLVLCAIAVGIVMTWGSRLNKS